jgi:hypothetical protein
VENFYGELVRLAKKGEMQRERARATDARRQIIRSLSALPDGDKLADNFSFTLRHFATTLYWRGYKDARRHREKLGSPHRPPKERRPFQQEVERMLRQHIEMTTKEICEKLDDRNVSATFHCENGTRINIGPDDRFWSEEARSSYVKQAIWRIRSRVKSEKRAKEFLQLSLPISQRTS